jgi:hypothetical protein
MMNVFSVKGAPLRPRSLASKEARRASTCPGRYPGWQADALTFLSCGQWLSRLSAAAQDVRTRRLLTVAGAAHFQDGAQRSPVVFPV